MIGTRVKVHLGLRESIMVWSSGRMLDFAPPRQWSLSKASMGTLKRVAGLTRDRFGGNIARQKMDDEQRRRVQEAFQVRKPRQEISLFNLFRPAYMRLHYFTCRCRCEAPCYPKKTWCFPKLQTQERIKKLRTCQNWIKVVLLCSMSYYVILNPGRIQTTH